MRFELFVALRYLLAPRRQARVPLVSIFSTLGGAVGVRGAIAHVYVAKAAGIDDYHAEVAKLQKIPGVLGAAPSVSGLGIVSTNRNDAFLTIKGIDPAL